MERYFTADHHFGHQNIIKYCNRPFRHATEMDQEMVRRWNSIVRMDDIVYHLGDFSLNTRIDEWLDQLNFGRMYFILGGHDGRWSRKLNLARYNNRVIISPPLKTVQFEKTILVLCHYPMISWDRSHHGAHHLHGHSHGTIPDDFSSDTKIPPNSRAGLRVDVGVDNWDFYPVSLDTLHERFERAKA